MTPELTAFIDALRAPVPSLSRKWVFSRYLHLVEESSGDTLGYFAEFKHKKHPDVRRLLLDPAAQHLSPTRELMRYVNTTHP